jgi:hypothetical protein
MLNSPWLEGDGREPDEGQAEQRGREFELHPMFCGGRYRLLKVCGG